MSGLQIMPPEIAIYLCEVIKETINKNLPQYEKVVNVHIKSDFEYEYSNTYFSVVKNGMIIINLHNKKTISCHLWITRIHKMMRLENGYGRIYFNTVEEFKNALLQSIKEINEKDY